MGYYDYLLFGEYCVIVSFQTIGFLSLSYGLFIKFSHSANSPFSFPIILYLTIIFFESFSTIIQGSYNLIWFNPGVGYSPFWLFTLTFLPYILVPGISAAVLFLTVHRIFVVLWINGKRVNKILYIVFSSVIFAVIVFDGIYIIFQYISLAPSLVNSKCLTMSCTVGTTTVQIYNWMKMLFGFFNVIASIVFIAILKRTTQQNQTTKNANKMALITILLELLLNVFPMTIDIVTTNFFNLRLNSIIGPYSHVFSAMDALVVSFIYSRNMIKHSYSSKVIAHSVQQTR